MQRKEEMERYRKKEGGGKEDKQGLEKEDHADSIHEY